MTQRKVNKKKRHKQNLNDTGFGSLVQDHSARFIRKDGSFNVLRRGGRAWTPYQELVEMSWTKFCIGIVICYLAINALFAVFFVLNGIQNINGLEPGTTIEDFIGAFFFSVQTFTTVGYGAMSPNGITANLLAATNALVGLVSFAMATGLFFARFSKPKAQILFSENGVIAPFEEGSSFQFRIANIRNNQIINLEAQVIAGMIERQANGKLQRRFAPLDLQINRITFFPLNWTIVHPITEDSPLYGKTPADFERIQLEILVQIKGYDETFAQMVHIHSSYTWNEIRWNTRFRTMYHTHMEKGTILDLDRINEVEEEEE